MNRLIILHITSKRRFIRLEESPMINICHPERNERMRMESKDLHNREDAPVRGQGIPASGPPSIYGDASTKLSMTNVVGRKEIDIPHRGILIARALKIRGDRLNMTGFDTEYDSERRVLQDQSDYRYSYKANKRLS